LPALLLDAEPAVGPGAGSGTGSAEGSGLGTDLDSALGSALGSDGGSGEGSGGGLGGGSIPVPFRGLTPAVNRVSVAATFVVGRIKDAARGAALLPAESLALLFE